MSLKINQETFNEAVVENMECFSMSIEESIDATVEQFKAQGVNLFGIVTDPDIISNGNPVRAIKSKFEAENNDDKKISLIQELENVIKKDVAYKVCCDQFKIFDMCLDALLSANISPELSQSIMDFLLLLLDGYPDLANERGCCYFLSLLDKEVSDQKYGLRLILVSCIKHEINRQKYIDKNIDENIMRIISRQPNDDILIILCKVISTLTLDDDSRIEIPKAYTHACKLADVLVKPFSIFLKVKKDPVTLRYILKALNSIVVNYAYCAIVEEEGGLPAVMSILEKHRDNEPLTTQCFKLLTTLVGNDAVKDKLMKFEIAEELHLSLNQFIHKKKNVNAVLTLISKISLRRPDYGKLFFQLDFPQLIVQALQVHSEDYLIQSSGCWCIRNMSSRNPDYHNQFLSHGAEDILNQILETNKCCSYNAKIALQELGCEVVAREPWTGEKGDKLAQTTN